MRILCVGDSNTWGYDPQNFWGEPYPHPWPELLGLLTGAEVINLGRCGREIPGRRGAYASMDGLIRSQGDFDLLILMLGTNDVLNISEPCKDLLEKRLSDYLDHLKKTYPRQKLLLLIPVNLTGMREVVIKNSEDFSESCRILAGQKDIPCLDLNDYGLPLAYDHIHLTAEGHRILAETLKCDLQKLYLF